MYKRHNEARYRADVARDHGTWRALLSRDGAARRSRNKNKTKTEKHLTVSQIFHREMLEIRRGNTSHRDTAANIRGEYYDGSRIAAVSWRTCFREAIMLASPYYRKVRSLYRTFVERALYACGYYPPGVTQAAVKGVVRTLGTEAYEYARTVRKLDCMSRGHTP